MTCEKAGEVTAKTRSKFLQLGAIFRTYSKVRRYLLYLSKQLYNPQQEYCCSVRVLCDHLVVIINSTFVFTVVVTIGWLPIPPIFFSQL